MVAHLSKWVGKNTTLQIDDEVLEGKVARHVLVDDSASKSCPVVSQYAFISNSGEVVRITGSQGEMDRVTATTHNPIGTKKTLVMDLERYSNGKYRTQPMEAYA